MSAREQNPYDNIARKWLALAERRKAYLIELHNSGRWKHYFTQANMRDEMLKVEQLCEQWAEVAGLAPQTNAELAPQTNKSPD